MNRKLRLAILLLSLAVCAFMLGWASALFWGAA